MIKDSLYAKYIKDRQNAEILENEFGFILYKLGERECFIMDMFIEESNRRSGLCRKLINNLAEIAKEKNLELISANIHLADKNATNTLMSAFCVGFKLFKAEHDVLLIIKNLRGE